MIKAGTDRIIDVSEYASLALRMSQGRKSRLRSRQLGHGHIGRPQPGAVRLLSH
jgi:hypothetical protein